MEIPYKELMKRAIAARKRAYAPYSRFAVGAALLTAEGRIFEGCNIENAAFTPGNCAERTAIFTAVSEGYRDFAAIAVVGAPARESFPRDLCPPCGVCRQVMMEFCDPERFPIIIGRGPEDYQILLLGELLPMGFGAGHIADV